MTPTVVLLGTKDTTLYVIFGEETIAVVKKAWNRLIAMNRIHN